MSLALEVTRVRAGVEVAVDPRRDPWSFVAIDPGVRGAIVWSRWVAPGTPRAILVCPIRGDYARVRAWIARNRPHLLQASALICEEQLAVGGRKPGSERSGGDRMGAALNLASMGGVLAGALSWTLALPISYLPPASWQTILGPDRTAKPDGKTTLTKPRAHELAERFLARHHGGSLDSYTKADAEGVADALGIMVWRALRLAQNEEQNEGSRTWLESSFSDFSWWRSVGAKPKRARRTPK